VGISGGFATLLKTPVQGDGYGGTNTKIQGVIIFLTAREFLVIEDISWIIRYAVFVLIGGIVVRSPYRRAVGQGI